MQGQIQDGGVVVSTHTVVCLLLVRPNSVHGDLLPIYCCESQSTPKSSKKKWAYTKVR